MYSRQHVRPCADRWMEGEGGYVGVQTVHRRWPCQYVLGMPQMPSLPDAMAMGRGLRLPHRYNAARSTENRGYAITVQFRNKGREMISRRLFLIRTGMGDCRDWFCMRDWRHLCSLLLIPSGNEKSVRAVGRGREQMAEAKVQTRQAKEWRKRRTEDGSRFWRWAKRAACLLRHSVWLGYHQPCRRLGSWKDRTQIRFVWVKKFQKRKSWGQWAKEVSKRKQQGRTTDFNARAHTHIHTHTHTHTHADPPTWNNREQQQGTTGRDRERWWYVRTVPTGRSGPSVGQVCTPYFAHFRHPCVVSAHRNLWISAGRYIKVHARRLPIVFIHPSTSTATQRWFMPS